jgi:thiol-disulfide isomerase/thioredoxin
MRRLMLAAATMVLLFQSVVVEADAAFDLAAHSGKVIVVDFWASWCVPCRRSFPWLNEMHDKYGSDGLVIIGVNLDASRMEADGFLSQYPARFAIHYDDNKALAKEFDVTAMPMSYVFGRDGREIARHFGFKVKKQTEYEAVIVEALTERSEVNE